MATKVKLWDGPTRIFHWSLALLFVISWRSAESGAMDWHYLSGITLLGLVLFRIIWGFIGGSTARFSHFVKSPAAAIAYARGQKGPAPLGHNPIGGYSVIAMLLALAVQLGTGLFAVDVDGIESGPLSFLVSFEAGRSAAQIHHLSFDLLLILVGLHLLAILFYAIIRKHPLIPQMITGKAQAGGGGQEALKPAGLIRFAVAAAISAATAWWVSNGLSL